MKKILLTVLTLLAFNLSAALPEKTVTDSGVRIDFGSSKIAVVKIGADWCGPCKVLEKELETMQLAHPDVAFQKVDLEKLPSEDRKNFPSIPVTRIMKVILTDDGEVFDVITETVVGNRPKEIEEIILKLKK